MTFCSSFFGGAVSPCNARRLIKREFESHCLFTPTVALIHRRRVIRSAQHHRVFDIVVIAFRQISPRTHYTDQELQAFEQCIQECIDSVAEQQAAATTTHAVNVVVAALPTMLALASRQNSR